MSFAIFQWVPKLGSVFDVDIFRIVRAKFDQSFRNLRHAVQRRSEKYGTFVQNPRLAFGIQCFGIGFVLFL